MPFHKSARVDADQSFRRKDRRVLLQHRLHRARFAAGGSAAFPGPMASRESRPIPSKNYTILETTGEGHFVGTALFMQARKPRGLGFLEGDEMVYVDGEDKALDQRHGHRRLFLQRLVLRSRPVQCAVSWRDDQGRSSKSRVSAYRWHIEDAMPYHKSIKVTIEHGTNNNVEADYSSVAYYYESGPAQSRLLRDSERSEGSVSPIELPEIGEDQRCHRRRITHRPCQGEQRRDERPADGSLPRRIQRRGAAVLAASNAPARRSTLDLLRQDRRRIRTSSATSPRPLITQRSTCESTMANRLRSICITTASSPAGRSIWER